MGALAIELTKFKTRFNIFLLQVSSHEGKYFRVKSTFNFAADLRDYPYVCKLEGTFCHFQIRYFYFFFV